MRPFGCARKDRDIFQIAKLADVARRAGVGNATASRALSGVGLVSEETRKRILKAARELNYQPNRSAQALKGGRSGMIGMVIPRMSDIFFASCVDAVQAVAMTNSSLLVVSATHDCSDRTMDAVKELLHHRVDGLVLALSEYLTPAMVRSLKTLPVPTVGIDAPLTKAGLPSVMIDNCSSAELATEHLVQHGYRRIISLQVNPELFTIQERHRGYERAMQSAGLPATQHVVEDRAAAEDLLRNCGRTGRDFALLAANEVAAKYVVAAAKQLRMNMPEDFGMISFDDFDLADAMETPLTVVKQPVGRIGEVAANLLFRGLNSEDGAAAKGGALETVLSAELVIRQSCGCKK